MGDNLFEAFDSAMGEAPPVSIRLNPWKWNGSREDVKLRAEDVPWCRYGVYLDSRPVFTLDPHLHAGVYYVQEAASMFVDYVIRQFVKEPVTTLDLCAAPGGKTTCALGALPKGSTLWSNEPMRNRANILSENTQKWMLGTDSLCGGTKVITTNCYARDYSKAKMSFDVILADVPCSGEGMFRKDAGAIAEWSLRNVEKCQRLQREIIGDIWQCLNPDGLLIYSTCTFNLHENEENVRWICEELGAKVLNVETEDSWGITGSLLENFNAPVYRFIPGKTKSEGLFMAVLRKAESYENAASGRRSKKTDGLNILEHSFLKEISSADNAPVVELSYDEAISYLRHEAIRLSDDTPRGIVRVAYKSHLLGLAKNVGNRANNLYPKEWRIKTTHLSESYSLT